MDKKNNKIGQGISITHLVDTLTIKRKETKNEKYILKFVHKNNGLDTLISCKKKNPTVLKLHQCQSCWHANEISSFLHVRKKKEAFST